MTIHIRLAEKDDAPLIRSFIDKLASYQKEGDSVRVNTSLLSAQLDSANPPFECLVAEFDDFPCGFALFYKNYSTWEGKPGIYLEDLYVEPDYRLHGIGRKLLIKLSEIALERGCTRLDWSVQSTNFKAIQFYSVLGARPMPEWLKWRLDEASMQELVNVEKGIYQFPEKIAEPVENRLKSVDCQDKNNLVRIY